MKTSSYNRTTICWSYFQSSSKNFSYGKSLYFSKNSWTFSLIFQKTYSLPSASLVSGLENVGFFVLCSVQLPVNSFLYTYGYLSFELWCTRKIPASNTHWFNFKLLRRHDLHSKEFSFWSISHRFTFEIQFLSLIILWVYCFRFRYGVILIFEQIVLLRKIWWKTKTLIESKTKKSWFPHTNCYRAMNKIIS